MAAFDYADAALATPLLRAITLNDRNGVREALSAGYSANLPNNKGSTPLHEAVIDDARIECLEELLLHTSANVNATNFFRETPLFLACQHKCVKAVRLLLSHPKCDVNITNNEGVSPLHAACNEKDIKIVKLLVNSGAKVNETDFSGFTPLHEAVSLGKGSKEGQDEKGREICLFLLSQGVNANAVDCEGNLAFHYACQNGFLKCVELLHSTSTDQGLINFVNGDGRTPLMIAATSQNEELIEMLLSNGANPDLEDINNTTALIFAAHSAHYGVFNLIYKATSQKCILKTCTFDEERDVKRILSSKNIHSLVCYAIDTEDLEFLTKVLETELVKAALHCPVVHAENMVKGSLTLHTPISFLLEGKMHDLGDETVPFLETLIDHGSPLKVTSNGNFVSYVNPICAALVALNDCPSALVMKCLRLLLLRGADPDEPPGRMPHAMEQACMRGCVDAVLLLLQYSNVLEPEDVIKWIEKETSLTQDQQKIIDTLLPLAPYYYASSLTLKPQVYPLTSYCRTVIRKEVHKETEKSPMRFNEMLLNLTLPKDLHSFLHFL